jgi:hypothetical protein
VRAGHSRENGPLVQARSTGADKSHKSIAFHLLMLHCARSRIGRVRGHFENLYGKGRDVSR